MKRAQPLVVYAGLLELDVATHDFDDVDAGQEILDEGEGNHCDSLVPAFGAASRHWRMRTFPTEIAVHLGLSELRMQVQVDTLRRASGHKPRVMCAVAHRIGAPR